MVLQAQEAEASRLRQQQLDAEEPPYSTELHKAVKQKNLQKTEHMLLDGATLKSDQFVAGMIDLEDVINVNAQEPAMLTTALHHAAYIKKEMLAKQICK